MRSALTLTLTLTVALLAVACDAPGGWFGTTAPRHGPEELWTNNGTEPDYLDPARASSTNAATLLINLFEGLTRPDPRTLEPEPGVAERWEVSPDGRVYTFFLRAEARWSDGLPVTAHDFVYAWLRALTPATGCKNASQLFIVRNAEAFFSGKARAADVGIRALSDRVFQVELVVPVPYFLPLITNNTTYLPVPRRVVERFVGSDTPERWTRPEHIVSNGAFRLAEWHFRHRLVLERNPRYWDAANVRLERVVAHEVESATASVNLYKTGELDDTGEGVALPVEFLEHLATKRDFVRAPYLGVYFYWFNTRARPVDDVRVRRALHHAVDRESLVRYVTRGGQQPTTALVPPLPGYPSPAGPGYDPARARALLAEAGYPGGRGFPPLTLIYNTAEGHRQIAEAVQQMWKRDLGIHVPIENQEWQVFLKHVELGEFQVARMGWIGDYADPNTFLEILRPDSGHNHSGWRDPEFKRLLDAADAEPDAARRMDLLRAAEARVLDALPILPIYVYTRSYLVKPYVRGHHPNILDDHPWRALWIDPAWRP